MQHLAQEIPKLLIVGNTEDIKGAGCVERESLCMHPVLIFFSLASAFVCCQRQDIGLDGPFIYPGMAVFRVWGVEWAVAVKTHHPGSDDPKRDFPLLPKPLWLLCFICFPQILLPAVVQHRGRERVGPLLKGCVLLCIYFGLDADIFFFSPLNREFRKVTSFLIPDSLWALKKILDNTEQLRCHFNSSFK